MILWQGGNCLFVCEVCFVCFGQHARVFVLVSLSSCFQQLPVFETSSFSELHFQRMSYAGGGHHSCDGISWDDQSLSGRVFFFFVVALFQGMAVPRRFVFVFHLIFFCVLECGRINAAFRG